MYYVNSAYCCSEGQLLFAGGGLTLVSSASTGATSLTWSLQGRVCIHAFIAVPPAGPYVCLEQENEGTLCAC